MAALFATQADFDQLQLEANLPLVGADGTITDDNTPLRPQDIAEDGWPKWMERVDFAQSNKSPFKVCLSSTLFPSLIVLDSHRDDRLRRR